MGSTYTVQQWQVLARQLADRLEAHLPDTAKLHLISSCADDQLLIASVRREQFPPPTPEQVAALVAAARLKRNAIYRADSVFEGEWIVIPREDFDALRAALAPWEQAR